MEIDVDEVVRRLRRAGVDLEPGLSSSEVRRVEERFEIRLNAGHRALLGEVLPVGRSWVDWRHADPADLRRRLDWPVDGVLFDVRHNAFWPHSWGPRPATPQDAEQVARRALAGVPRLVPVFSHRYLPDAAFPLDSPVFSVHQSDVIFYGDNLLDYVAHEFGGAPAPNPQRPWVPFWSALATGADQADL